MPFRSIRSIASASSTKSSAVKPILVVHQPKSDTTTAFVAIADGTRLTFAEANARATELVDRQTQSKWDAYGSCISGKLKGKQLEPLIMEPEYWFAWSEFHPTTTIFEPAAGR